MVLGLAAGAVVFFVGDLLIDRRGGEHRKSSEGEVRESGNANAIVLGSLLDGVPESVAISVSLIGDGAVGAAVVAAVSLSNIPEAMSASAGMRESGKSMRYIRSQAFAAGAILTMLSELSSTPTAWSAWPPWPVSRWRSCSAWPAAEPGLAAHAPWCLGLPALPTPCG